MKINERYEIRVVIVELRENGTTTGDVYDSLEKFRKNHPFSSYKFGYIVFDTETGYMPDNCNDWNDSPEEAMFDYEDNCRDNLEYDLYEVEFGIAADGAGTENYEAPYSMCIKATCCPSIKDAETFLKKDMKTLGYDAVHSVTLISRSEVHSFFDDSNIDSWPIYTVPANSEGFREIAEREYRFNVAFCEGQYFGEYNTTGRSIGEAMDKALMYFSDNLAKILPEYDIPISVTLIE